MSAVNATPPTDAHAGARPRTIAIPIALRCAVRDVACASVCRTTRALPSVCSRRRDSRRSAPHERRRRRRRRPLCYSALCGVLIAGAIGPPQTIYKCLAYSKVKVTIQ